MLTIVGTWSPTGVPFDDSTLSGRRLVEWSGLESRSELAERVELANVLSGDPSHAELARVEAEKYSLRVGRRDRTIVVGTETLRLLGSRAFPPGFDYPEWLEWYDSRCGARCALLPHPSGKNRMINEAGVRDRCAAFVAEAVRKHGKRSEASSSRTR